MRVAFCPFCGKRTKTGESEGRGEGSGRWEGADIRFCGGCGEDISHLHVGDPLRGDPGGIATGAVSDNVIVRSKVLGVTGARAGAGDTAEAGTSAETGNAGDAGKAPESGNATGAARAIGGGGGIKDSVIQRSVVTSIGSVNIRKGAACPLCGNALTDENRLTRCSECSVQVCGICLSRVKRGKERYRGYRLELPSGLCPQCYAMKRKKLKAGIDERVWAALSGNGREEELRESYDQTESELLRQGEETLMEGDFDKALDLFDRVLDINSNNLHAARGKWSALIELDCHRQAAEVLEATKGKYPWFTGAYVVLGEVYYRLGEADRAKAVLIKRLKETGDRPALLIKLGEIYLEEGDLGKAAPVFKRASAADRDRAFVEPRLYLASILLESGDYKGASEQIKEGRKIDADDQDLAALSRELLTLSRVCLDTIRRSKEKLEGETDEGARLRYLREIGDGLASLGQREKAAEYYGRYLEAEPGDEGVRKKLRSLEDVGE